MKRSYVSVLAGMQDVSESDTVAPALQMLPLGDILPNGANFYQLRDLDALADSIAMEGLQQPLVVTPESAAQGKYRLISGHRRRAAIEKLVTDKEHPREDLRQVPCLVRTYASPAMAELQLILANSTARVLTSAETMRQAERLEMLLYQLKEEGYQFPGRMRDQVAAACKASAPKLARLKVIREKLIPGYMALFEKGKLPEQTAYALARFPAEFQERIFKAVDPASLMGYAVEAVYRHYEKGLRWEPELNCPDGMPCKRGDAFLHHDLETSGEMCGGERCCLKCDRATRNYAVCKRMCSKAKAQRQEKNAAGRSSQEEAAVENTRKHQAATQKNARRLLKAIDAAGWPDEESFRWEYWSQISVCQVRDWAAGDFTVWKLWHGEMLSPKSLHDPLELASRLGCSTDFLLGVSEDLRPGAAGDTPPGADLWRTDTDYPEGVLLAVVFRFDDIRVRELLTAKNGTLYFPGKFDDSHAMDLPVLRWFPLPPEPEVGIEEDDDERMDDLP